MTGDDQDWRLQAHVGSPGGEAELTHLVGRIREPAAGDAALADVPDDVVLTHDGTELFAYALTRESLEQARTALESRLTADGVSAAIVLSHWDETRDEWRQVDPPLDAEQARAQAQADRDADAPETRTLVASAGRLVRGEFEQTMLAAAEKLGLSCEIFEHRHLLTTQVGFTVTGPRRRIQEFAQELRAEGWMMTRTESTVMLNPL